MENGFSELQIELVAEHAQKMLIMRKICIGAEHEHMLPVKRSAITEIRKSNSQLDLLILLMSSFTNDHPVPTSVLRAV